MSKNSHSFSQKDAMVFCRVGGNVWICRDVFRGYNGALSGRGVFVITDRRATLRSPYAIHSCAVGAFATGGSSQRARDSGAEWNFAVLAARNTKENRLIFPNGEKLASAGQAQRSPVYPEKKFSTLKECNWKEVA